MSDREVFDAYRDLAQKKIDVYKNHKYGSNHYPALLVGSLLSLGSYITPDMLTTSMKSSAAVLVGISAYKLIKNIKDIKELSQSQLSFIKKFGDNEDKNKATTIEADHHALSFDISKALKNIKKFAIIGAALHIGERMFQDTSIIEQFTSNPLLEASTIAIVAGTAGIIIPDLIGKSLTKVRDKGQALVENEDNNDFIRNIASRRSNRLKNVIESAKVQIDIKNDEIEKNKKDIKPM